MTQGTIDTINRQTKAKGQPEGSMFSNIDMRTIISDFDALLQELDPEFDDNDTDNNSYLTSDNLTVKGNHAMGDVDPININAKIQENNFNIEFSIAQN